MSQAPQASFLIQKIFTSSFSFEAPGTPLSFQGDWKPEAHVDIQSEHRTIEKDLYEVSLTLTLTVKNQEKLAFLVEVKQSGIFTISGLDNQLSSVLGSYCPSSLFPYARDAINNMIAKAGFPEVHLAPINFDALHAQAQQEKQGKTVH